MSVTAEGAVVFERLHPTIYVGLGLEVFLIQNFNSNHSFHQNAFYNYMLGYVFY